MALVEGRPEGDVVECSVDYDAGILRFCLNGAQVGADVSLEEHPSLAGALWPGCRSPDEQPMGNKGID